MDIDLFLFDMFILLITNGYDLQWHGTINLCKKRKANNFSNLKYLAIFNSVFSRWSILKGNLK